LKVDRLPHSPLSTRDGDLRGHFRASHHLRPAWAGTESELRPLLARRGSRPVSARSPVTWRSGIPRSLFLPLSRLSGGHCRPACHVPRHRLSMSGASCSGCAPKLRVANRKQQLPRTSDEAHRKSHVWSLVDAVIAVRSEVTATYALVRPSGRQWPLGSISLSRADAATSDGFPRRHMSCKREPPRCQGHISIDLGIGWRALRLNRALGGLLEGVCHTITPPPSPAMLVVAHAVVSA